MFQRSWPQLLCVVIAAPAALAQTPTDPSDSLFVPDLNVPLSAFVDDDGTAGVVSLAIQPRVLTWIQSHSGTISVARNDSTGITYLAPTSVTAPGTVTLNSTTPGTFVVVVDLLQNDFFPVGTDKSAVVTHWNAARNDPPGPAAPRGGQEIGANDALGLFDYTGSAWISCEGDNPQLTDTKFGIINNTNPAHGDAFGQYKYSTDLHAWFSDGTEVTPQKDGEIADADVPAFEQYIGENYATHGVTRLGCVWLSDRSRETGGYPVLHRNHPFALDLTAPAAKQVIDGAPVIQVVHGHLVDHQDATIPGSESSLASFLLPPGWTRSATEPYPALLIGHYDIHSTTFGILGLRALKTIGDLAKNSNRRAIGLIWNGGGAGVAQTVHGSAYKNCDQLMLDADALVKADRQRVVITGGSRSGTAALEMAANPGSSVYRTWFVSATNPQVRPDETLTTYNNNTYGLVQSTIDSMTGYVNSSLPGWSGPGGASASNIALDVMFGTTNLTTIATNHVVDSALFRGALLSKGVAVALRTGTNDFSHPLSHESDFAAHLNADGVPLYFEIKYRFGHAYPEGTGPTEETLLLKVFNGDTTLAQTGTFQYRRKSTLEYDCEVLFTPTHTPLVIEAPLSLGPGQSGTMRISGAPGTSYSVIAAEVLDPTWLPLAPPASGSLGTPFVVTAGTLPASTAQFSHATHVLALPPTYSANQRYWYGAVYTPPGGGSFVATSGSGSMPIAEEPYLEFFPTAAVGADLASRTGGLASDGLFP